MNNLNYTLNFELNPVIETLEAQTRAAAAAEGRLALGLAGRADICEALKKILGVFFPNRYLEEKIENDEMNIYIGDNLRQAARLLQKHIADALCLKESEECAQSREKADEIVRKLLFSLPQIRQDLMEDVNTGYYPPHHERICPLAKRHRHSSGSGNPARLFYRPRYRCRHRRDLPHRPQCHSVSGGYLGSHFAFRHQRYADTGTETASRYRR